MTAEEGQNNKQGSTAMLASSQQPEYRQTEETNSNVCRRQPILSLIVVDR